MRSFGINSGRERNASVCFCKFLLHIFPHTQPAGIALRNQAGSKGSPRKSSRKLPWDHCASRIEKFCGTEFEKAPQICRTGDCGWQRRVNLAPVRTLQIQTSNSIENEKEKYIRNNDLNRQRCPLQSAFVSIAGDGSLPACSRKAGPRFNRDALPND